MVLMGRERTKRGPAEVGGNGMERSATIFVVSTKMRELGAFDAFKLTSTLNLKHIVRSLHCECACRGTESAHLAAVVHDSRLKNTRVVKKRN